MTLIVDWLTEIAKVFSGTGQSIEPSPSDIPSPRCPGHRADMTKGKSLKCRICGNESQNQTFEVREMMFGFGDIFRYFQCSKCECLQIEDYPHNISKYYPEVYYSYDTSFHRNKLKSFLIRLRDNYALFDKGLIGKLLYDRHPREDLRCLRIFSDWRNKSILDVGCGSGAFLFPLRELGMERVLGIDPFNRKDIEYGNGLRIQKKEIHDVQGQWDLVTFHHSFEHIYDPVRTMETVSRLLAPNGRCLIRIPTVSSFAWKHYGVQWVQLDAPRHFFLHSIQSMNIVAEQAGLSLCNVVYDSNGFQFWGSEQYVKGIPLRDKRSYLVNQTASIFSKREIASFRERAKELNVVNQGDQAIFCLAKKGNC